MTKKWKIELVETLKIIAETLPELTEELRRFNNQNDERIECENQADSNVADSYRHSDS